MRGESPHLWGYISKSGHHNFCKIWIKFATAATGRLLPATDADLDIFYHLHPVPCATSLSSDGNLVLYRAWEQVLTSGKASGVFWSVQLHPGCNNGVGLTPIHQLSGNLGIKTDNPREHMPGITFYTTIC